MAGLTFDDAPAPDPQSPLIGWLDEWIGSLGRASRTTAAGYVSDAAGFAAVLADVVATPVPALVNDAEGVRLAAADDAVVALATTFGVRPGSYVRTRELFAVLVLADLAPRNLARTLDRFLATHSPNSARRAAAAWSSYCRYLVGQQVLAANPMTHQAVERPKEVRGDPTPLTYPELERVFSVVRVPGPGERHPWPARDLAAAAVFVSTGVRLDEAISAAVGDFTDGVDTGARLRVWGKGNKPRTIPVHDEAALAVRDYLAERAGRVGRVRADDALFVRWDGKPFSPQAMRRLVEGWYARAGVRRHPGAAVHALRHSFGTAALDSGASITEVQKLMGHASLATTQRYLAVVGSGLEQAVAAHPSRALLGRTRVDAGPDPARRPSSPDAGSAPPTS